MPRELFRQGDPLTRQGLNAIVPTVYRNILAGPGIRILPTADGICIMSDNKNSFQPGLGGGGGGASEPFMPVPVDELPPVPEEGYACVFWRNAALGGTGDNQIWTCYAPQDRWYCQDGYTTHTGEVV